jgi:hypothetical protein
MRTGEAIDPYNGGDERHPGTDRRRIVGTGQIVKVTASSAQ